MGARSNFIMRLAATCQLADERAAAHPHDHTAARYAEALSELFHHALELPDDHVLFQRWQRHQWLPIEPVDEVETRGHCF